MFTIMIKETAFLTLREPPNKNVCGDVPKILFYRTTVDPPNGGNYASSLVLNYLLWNHLDNKNKQTPTVSQERKRTIFDTLNCLCTVLMIILRGACISE